MSEDVKPYGAADDPAVARVMEFRALLADLEKSQREGADLIEMETRTIRRFLTGETPPPITVIYAMRYLRAVKRGDLGDAEAWLMDKLAGGHYAAAGSMSDVVPRTGGRRNIEYKEFVRDGAEHEPGKKGNR